MLDKLKISPWPGVIRYYESRLDIDKKVAPVTLLEGNTPLISAPRLAAAMGGGFELFLKYEGQNPTGSFKDRGMTTAITQAVADGAKAVICASTGNTAASAAAYAARAGLRCYVLIPEGKIAIGKLAAALIYGAKVIALKGSFDDGMRLVREAERSTSLVVVNSINPARMQGQKTAAFEICDVLGSAPDWHCLPVGNAGNITAYWMGYSEYWRDGVIDHRPQLLGVQAAGAAPIVENRVIEQPETIATAIRIGNPARWQDATAALHESNGFICAVSDQQILHAYRLIAECEGVFCEPSSAASVAGLMKAIREQRFDVRRKKVVCVLTGHGLKDPNIALQTNSEPVAIHPTMDNLLKIIEE